MGLADEIDKIRANSLIALSAGHDYYIHTREAWRLIQQLIQQGRAITFQNQWTGMTVTENELPGLAQSYVTGYLASATFQHFVSLFEEFVFDLLRLWLNAYPQNLGKRELKFQTVLDSPDKSQIVASVVEKELLGVAYRRVDDWFAYLNDLVKLNCPQADEIHRLSEIKASRDILVHNKGIVNETYVKKSLAKARFRVGEKLVISEQYHRESWQLMQSVIVDVADAAIQKC